MKKIMLMLISIGIMSCASTKQLKIVDDGSNMVKVSLGAKPMNISGKRINEYIHHGEYVELISFTNDEISKIVNIEGDTCYYYTESLIIPTYIFDRTVKEVVCDCKYIKYGVDKFTKQHNIRTQGEILSLNLLSGYNMYIQGVKYGDSKYLFLTFISGNIFSISDDSEFMLLFENGETLVLNNKEYVIADATYTYGAYTNWTGIMKYELNIHDENMILSNAVTSIRLYTTKGYIEMDVKEKNSENISKVIKCINK